VNAGARLEAALLLLAGLFLLLSRDLSALGPAFEPPPRSPSSLRVVTWNLGGADGGETHPFREDTLPAVAASLRRAEADLVLLQEAGDDGLLQRLADELGSGWRVEHGRGGVAALVARGDCARWRPPLGRTLGLRLELGGTTVAVAAVHSSPFSARDRGRELGPLVDALLEQEADVHLLAGDLNLDLDLDKRGDLFSNDPHRDVESYNALAAHLVDVARRGGPTAQPDRRLDYVFASPGVPVLAAGVWHGQRVGSMDHDPVVVDLGL